MVSTYALDRQNLRTLSVWAGFILLFNGSLFVYLVLDGPGMTTVDNVAQFLGPLLVLPLCGAWWRSSGTFARRRSAIVRMLIALSATFFAVGQFVWAWYELVLKQPTPFPSYADIFFMLSYPCLMAAVLLTPQRRLSFAASLRVALDGAIVLAALVTLSWYFILGPTVMQGGESALGRVVGTTYPFWDVALLACVLVLIPSLGRGTHLIAGTTIAAGLFILIVADGVFDYGTLHETYATGSLADVGWPLAYMTMCLGAGMLRLPVIASRESEVRPRTASLRGRLWAALLPYALIPPVVVLFIYVVHVAHDQALRTGVEIGSASLFALVLVRQVVALVENSYLAGRLHTRNDELHEANRRLQELATTDPHTGLPNHRAVVASLGSELERAFRYQRPCSLLFIDLDHFKTVNDGLGHGAGDVVLNQIAMVLRTGLRSIDMLGRWGGEEFVVILPETSKEDAVLIAERLRITVADHVFTVGDGLHLTCSIGFASFPGEARDSDLLVEMADRAMYAAKRLGRNQVRSASDPVVQFAEPSAASELRDESGLGGAVEALCAMVDAKDPYAGAHAADVAGLAVRVSLALGLDANHAHRVGLCGRLHDVGKVAVPDTVLRKLGDHTTEELTLVRSHPAVGADVLARMPALRHLAPMVRSHHERWDGHGYPDRLSRDEIPLEARIVCVADAFVAMTTHRPYRPRRSIDEALKELRLHAGSQFDPRVVDALERALSTEVEVAELLVS